jgi:hypothetical protein
MATKDTALNAVLEPGEAHSQHADLKAKSVGLSFAFVFVLVALAPLLHGRDIRWWSVLVGTGFLSAALLLPGNLVPLARVWTRVAAILHVISTRVLMTVLFFGVISPVACVMRLMERDQLLIKLDRSADSYWLPRSSDPITSDSLKNQF